MPDFAQLIRELRESYGESQRKFAAGCNLTQATISEIESGKYDPSVQTLLAICAGTGCKVVLGAKSGKVFVIRGE